MIGIKSSGNTNNIEKLISRAIDKARIINTLNKYGKIGVERLTLATPIDTGKTALSWEYKVTVNRNGSYNLSWYNTNMTKMNIPVAILIQYGHGTRDGYYIPGIDYINPAIQPVLQKLSDELWKEVTK